MPRIGPGRPRTRPDAVLGDKAYSARTHRQRLRAAGVTAAIPEPFDQVRHRLARGSDGGRPPIFDDTRYRDRNYRAAVMLHTVITRARSFRDTL